MFRAIQILVSDCIQCPEILFEGKLGSASSDTRIVLEEIFNSIKLKYKETANFQFSSVGTDGRNALFHTIDCNGGSLPSRVLQVQGSKFFLVAVQNCTVIDEEVILCDKLYKLCGFISRTDGEICTRLLKSGVWHSYTGNSTPQTALVSNKLINFDLLFFKQTIEVLLYTRCQMEVIECSSALTGYCATTLLADDPGLPWLLPEEKEFGKMAVIFNPPATLSILSFNNHKSSRVVVVIKGDVEHRVEIAFSSASEEKQLRDLQRFGCIRRLHLVVHGDPNVTGPFGLDRLYVVAEPNPTHGDAAPVVAVFTEMCRDSNNNDKFADKPGAGDCGSDQMEVFTPEGSNTTTSKRELSPGLTAASKRTKSLSSTDTAPVNVVKLSDMDNDFFDKKVVLISSVLRDVPRLAKAVSELGGIVKTKGFYRLYDLYIGELDDSPELRLIIQSNYLRDTTRLVYPELLMHVYQRKCDRSQPLED